VQKLCQNKACRAKKNLQTQKVCRYSLSAEVD
jgi:hypothetical protein